MIHHTIPRRLFLLLLAPLIACIVFLVSFFSARAEVVVEPIPVSRPGESFQIIREPSSSGVPAVVARSFERRARGAVTDPGAIESQLVRARGEIESQGFVILPDWTREKTYRNENDLVIERAWWAVAKSDMGFSPQDVVGSQFSTAGVSAPKGVLTIQAIDHDQVQMDAIDPAQLAKITGKSLNEAKTYLEGVCGCRVKDIRVFSLNKEKIPPLASQISVSIDT